MSVNTTATAATSVVSVKETDKAPNLPKQGDAVKPKTDSQVNGLLTDLQTAMESYYDELAREFEEGKAVDRDKKKLFKEIHRVLKEGGRAVISDIVTDEEPSEAIRNDPDLWSGLPAGLTV